MNRFGRTQYDRDESRYDDFYNRGRPDRARDGVGRDDWGANRERDLFNNRGAGEFGRRDDRGIMAAALQAHQAQNVLAALNQANRFQASGLLPTPGGRYQDRDRRNAGAYRGGARGGNRPGEKRKQDGGYSNAYGKQKDRRPVSSTKPRDDKDKKEKVVKEELIVIDDIDIPDEEIEIPDSLMDEVEKLRQREKVERNTADEDMGKLKVFCYTGKGYQCLTCDTFVAKDTNFEAHLKNKAHVMAVIDARGDGEKYKPVRDILDIDMSDDWLENSEIAQTILKKQAKQILIGQKEKEAREMANYNKNPANFFNCELGNLKLARKDEDKLVFTHLFEATMTVNDFTGDRFFGCEFIKAECGFNCRLCNLYIKDANNIIGHIDSRSHKQMYQNFLRKNSEYEKKQKKQNTELADALKVEESKNVILNEPVDKEFIKIAADQCARIPDLLITKEQEAAKKAAEKEAKEKEAKEKAEKEKAEKEKLAKEEAEKDAKEKAEKEKEGEGAEKTEETAEKEEEDEVVTIEDTEEAEDKDEEMPEEAAKEEEEVVEVDAKEEKEVPVEKAKDTPKKSARTPRGKKGKADEKKDVEKEDEKAEEAKKDDEKEDKVEEKKGVSSSWCDDY